MSTSSPVQYSLKDASIPNSCKKLRACKTCRLIKSDEQVITLFLTNNSLMTPVVKTVHSWTTLMLTHSEITPQ